MRIINDKNEILDSTVSLEKYDEILCLVLESRGGGKGTPLERNTDYNESLDTVLSRLKNHNIKLIKIYLASRLSKNKSTELRIVTVDGKNEIDFRNYKPVELRLKIGRFLADIKDNPNSKGGNRTKRILISADLSINEWNNILSNNSEYVIQDNNYFDDENLEYFDPKNIKDAVEKTLRSISVRRGQFKFRKKILKIYDNKCAITASTVLPILQAAHIYPYRGKETNHLTNGILLRSDIHDLFDLSLIGIDKEYKIVVSEQLKGTEYEEYNGKSIYLPKDIKERPSKESLNMRPLPYRKL